MSLKRYPVSSFQGYLGSYDWSSKVGQNPTGGMRERV